MAGSTVMTFELAVSDVDRGVYETLPLRVAQHPSESAEYLVARILAYALEYTEGLAFTQGLSAAEEPALEIRDLTGVRLGWIEIGTPVPERLHRATKAAERVAVYCHKDPTPWLRALGAAKVHAPDRLHLFGLDRAFVSKLAATLDRRNAWSVSRNEGELYVEAGSVSLATVVTPLSPG
jgi:uncharacterized protein YaeQ